MTMYDSESRPQRFPSGGGVFSVFQNQIALCEKRRKKVGDVSFWVYLQILAIRTNSVKLTGDSCTVKICTKFHENANQKLNIQ
jgi:hypothetical protein